MTEPTRDFKNAVAPEPLTRLLSGSFDHTAVDRIIASLVECGDPVPQRAQGGWGGAVTDHDPSVRYFGKRVLVYLNRDEFAWGLIIGGAEHVLNRDNLRTLLRSLRRLRDFQAGREAAARKAAKEEM